MMLNLNRNRKISKISNGKQAEKERKLIRVFEMIICIVIRLVFLFQTTFSIYFLISFFDEYLYLALTLCVFSIIVDCVYVSVYRFGKEYTWFSIGTLCYTFVIIVLIWNLVLIKFKKLNNECVQGHDEDNKLSSLNLSNRSDFNELKEYWLFAHLSLCQLLEITVATFIITCCVTRWAFPITRKLHRESLSNLLLSFITNGSDIVEFFGYIDEMDINLSSLISILILVFFSLSAFQFSFTLSAKIETNCSITDSLKKKLYYLVFGTEIWAIILIMLVQDLPFLIIRSIILIYYPNVQSNYTLYFFVAKSFILVLFELYYIIIIISENEYKWHKLGDIQMTQF